jgi:hypothetical protein
MFMIMAERNKLKKGIFLFIAFTLSLTGGAKRYYVSNAGNDSGTGLSESQAWKTLEKVQSFDFSSYDTISFRCGDIFYGSFLFGTGKTYMNPLTLNSYGSGEKPVITGFTAVNDWTYLGNDIWESTDAVSSLPACNMVVVNGVNTAMGRWPNAGDANDSYAVFQSFNDYSITSSNLTGSVNWTGAEAVIKRNGYALERRIIKRQSGSTITYETAIPVRLAGYGFIIQNDPRTLDQQNEWYYNPNTGKIQIFSAQKPVDVKVASVENLFILEATADNSTIDGIEFTGANRHAIYRVSPSGSKIAGVKILNCNIRFTGRDAVYITGRNFVIENNTISDINGSGLFLYGVKTVLVRNNTIENIGLHIGMPESWGANSGIVLENAPDATVEYNTIRNVRYDGINIGGINAFNGIIRYNIIDNFCLLLNDGGAIYGSYYSSAKIYNNIITNGKGTITGSPHSQAQAVGIYLDNKVDSCEVFNNTVYNCSLFGMQMNNNTYIHVHDNTFFNSSTQIRINHFSGSDYPVGNDVSGNLFIARTATQMAMNLYSYNDALHDFAAFDHNCYARPIDQGKVISAIQPSVGAYPAYLFTVEEWQAFSGKDANARKSPRTITSTDDILFEYNVTKNDKTVLLNQPMVDFSGVKYTGSATIPPFSSVVLIKDKDPSTGWAFFRTDNLQIQVYPNPTQGKFTVRLPETFTADSHLDILDPSGREIVSRITKEGSEEFDLGNRSPGVYVIRVTTGSQKKTSKIIVSKNSEK